MVGFVTEPAHGWDDAYGGTPPWDIGHPQPAFAALAESGDISGRVLDVGCGTGEHVLMAAGLGLPAAGVDFSPAALAIARRKAAERNLNVRFTVHDALDLGALSERFDTVLDCGLFHVFDDDDRGRYVDSLREVLTPGGRYFMLCFSDRQPGGFGPRRVRREEIEAAFADGWRIDEIIAWTMEVTIDPAGVRAWRTAITRRLRRSSPCFQLVAVGVPGWLGSIGVCAAGQAECGGAPPSRRRIRERSPASTRGCWTGR
jgi:SAM-dependent methyltransferase